MSFNLIISINQNQFIKMRNLNFSDINNDIDREAQNEWIRFVVSND